MCGGKAELLASPERTSLCDTERAVKDAQEERWRAFQLLDAVAREEGPTALGRRAAVKAIECLQRINQERFGHGDEIASAQARLVASLKKRPS